MRSLAGRRSRRGIAVASVDRAGQSIFFDSGLFCSLLFSSIVFKPEQKTGERERTEVKRSGYGRMADESGIPSARAAITFSSCGAVALSTFVSTTVITESST